MNRKSGVRGCIISKCERVWYGVWWYDKECERICHEHGCERVCHEQKSDLGSV